MSPKITNHSQDLSIVAIILIINFHNFDLKWSNLIFLYAGGVNLEFSVPDYFDNSDFSCTPRPPNCRLPNRQNSKTSN